jgi:hypothetical protein
VCNSSKSYLPISFGSASWARFPDSIKGLACIYMNMILDGEICLRNGHYGLLKFMAQFILKRRFKRRRDTMTYKDVSSRVTLLAKYVDITGGKLNEKREKVQQVKGSDFDTMLKFMSSIHFKKTSSNRRRSTP